MKTIKILIADDHAMFREGLKIALNSQQNIKVIGEATNGKQAVELSIKLRPHIILMDINMPNMGGLDKNRSALALFYFS